MCASLFAVAAGQTARRDSREASGECFYFPLVYLKGGKSSSVKCLRVCCSQDTSSRAPTGSPRTSNRSAAANVANAMPQSGKPSPPFCRSRHCDSTPRFHTSVSVLCRSDERGRAGQFLQQPTDEEIGDGSDGDARGREQHSRNGSQVR